jgi:hypothetical protein
VLDFVYCVVGRGGGVYNTVFRKRGLTLSSDGMGWRVEVDARLAGPLEGVGVYHCRPGLRRRKHELSHSNESTNQMRQLITGLLFVV